MPELKELLVDELQDLLNAESQIAGVLPKMVEAAHCTRLKSALEKHLVQTEKHVERARSALEMLGGDGQSKPCHGIKGILDEGQERMRETREKDEFAADLALIAAAQKVEHYEISAYGTAHRLAKQIGEQEVAKMLSHTLGEEEATDFLLTEVAKPLLHDATVAEFGDESKSPWGEIGDTASETQLEKNHGRVTSGRGVHARGKENQSVAAAAGEGSIGGPTRKARG